MGKGVPSDYERLRRKDFRWFSVKIVYGKISRRYEYFNVSMIRNGLLFRLSGVAHSGCFASYSKQSRRLII